MSELGSGTSVGIESVEWQRAGGGDLAVRVTGRWRRRRPLFGSELRSPATLVVETDGRRRRFPAMPEPPSLTGAPPGTWRLSFSVAAEFAPGPDSRSWLALGSTVVPLPGPEPSPDPAPAPAAPSPPPPAAEVAGQAAPDVPRAAPEPAEPTPALEIERAWRRAEGAERTAAELGERIAELQSALDTERRERAELSDRVARSRDREAGRLAVERALRAQRAHAVPRVPAEPRLVREAPAPVPEPLPPELGEPDVVGALRAELGARARAEAGLRARLVQAETRLAARVLLEQRTAATLQELRSELGRLAEALDDERDRRTRAEAEAARLRDELGGRRERSRDAYDAIGEIRGALEHLRGPEAGPQAPGAPSAGIVPATVPPPAGAVSPDRLSDALARLREAQEPREGAPAAEVAPDARPPAVSPGVSGVPGVPGGATVAVALRRLARHDADLAGQVLLDLLPAQASAYPHPIAYDLVLGTGHGCVQVTTGVDRVEVLASGAARAHEQVAFRVLGDPARIVRRLLATPLRRLLPVGLARVRGHRDGVAALRALLGLPLELTTLSEAGLRARPETVLALVAAMIQPAWTAGDAFTLAAVGEDGAGAYLRVRDGHHPQVTREPPAGRIAVTLTGDGNRLLAVLTGDGAGAGVSGDTGTLDVVRGWIRRARSG